VLSVQAIIMEHPQRSLLAKHWELDPDCVFLNHGSFGATPTHIRNEQRGWMNLLEEVAKQWEYSLMLRLLGPHQGIRLERLRAELDDRYEAQNQRLSSIEPEPHDQTEMVEEAMNVDEKSVPVIQPDKPAANLSGVADGKGYEWITQDDGMAWFRIENSDSEWELFEA
jgi:hypothetical protein